MEGLEMLLQLKPFKKIIHIHLEAVGLFPGCFDVFFPLRSLNQVAVDSVQIADQGGERRPDVVGKAGHHLPVGLIALIELRDCIPIPLRNSVDFIKKGRHNIIRRCQHTAVQIAVSDIFKCLIHIPDAFACLIEFPCQNKSRAAGKEQKRCNSNERVLEIAPVNVTEMTQTVLSDWLPVFEQNEMNYAFFIPEKRMTVSLDTAAYRRILNNLIQNVVSHSGASAISVGVEEKKDSVEIWVKDNGRGIPAEELDHIFDRLYKCDPARMGKGSGLGLSIVEQLVRLQNGDIRVMSEVGKGTRFLLDFKLV
ncbi:histidine kinase [Eubacterium callanderi]|uniref:histidine kinase n=1 Tax=Eubacterium callanderi TaxID=53442 RepID=E3GEI0_9FIRM|nr:histidine kinase [Eubacterium callanderi]